MSPADFRRYALFYLGYYGALGAYTPYIGRWVAANGHGGYVVGAMLALWYGGRIVAPPTWARLSARSQFPGRWLVAGCALATLGFAGFAGFDTGIMLFATMAWFGLCFNAVMPQFEAMTLSTLGPRNHDYGRIRMWGSIGFLIVAGSYGWLLDRLGNDAFVWLTLPWLLLTVAAAWLHRGDRPHAIETPAGNGAEGLWRRPGTRHLLVTALLMQLGFGPFYVFYTLHLQAQGHDGFAVGALWAIGVLCEILMFWVAPRLVQRYGAHRLMTACIAATVLRWCIVAAFGSSFAWMALAQTGHALGFAAFHAGCMRRMAELFPERRDMAAAQGMLYGFSGGIGGVAGAGVAAVAWQLGGGKAAFLAGALASVGALLAHALPVRAARPASVTSCPAIGRPLTQSRGRRMKKWLAVPVIALLVLLGWVAAGPFMTINSIREAIQAEDTSALAEHVDFPILRRNLRAQLEDYLARRAGKRFQDNAFGALALGLANRAAAGAVDAVATPAGIGAVLQGRGLLHRITGGGIRDDDTYAHAPPPDPLRDARHRFESPSRFTATVRNGDGDPVVFVLHRQGLRWKLDDIRLPLDGADVATY